MTTSRPVPEVWFLTGSQQMYGPGTLEQVAVQSQDVVARLEHRAAARIDRLATRRMQHLGERARERIAVGVVVFDPAHHSRHECPWRSVLATALAGPHVPAG